MPQQPAQLTIPISRHYIRHWLRGTIGIAVQVGNRDWYIVTLKDDPYVIPPPSIWQRLAWRIGIPCKGMKA